jgi:hypothetical protein
MILDWPQAGRKRLFASHRDLSLLAKLLITDLPIQISQMRGVLFVYGCRACQGTIDDVVASLSRLAFRASLAALQVRFSGINPQALRHPSGLFRDLYPFFNMHPLNLFQSSPGMAPGEISAHSLKAVNIGSLGSAC